MHTDIVCGVCYTFLLWQVSERLKAADRAAEDAQMENTERTFRYRYRYIYTQVILRRQAGVAWGILSNRCVTPTSGPRAARAAALSRAREIRGTCIVQIQMRPGCYRMCVQWFVKFS